MIRDHARHHGLTDRYSPDAHAWVVAPFGGNIGLVAVAIDGLARRQDRRGRLHRKARHHRLTGRDAPKNAARIVGEEARLAVISHSHFVGVVLAGQFGGSEASADLDALDRVDPHQCTGKIAIELAVDRSTETRWDAFGNDLDDRADRGAFLADAIEIVRKASRRLGIRTKERIAFDLGPVPGAPVDLVRSDLDQGRAHIEPWHDLAGDGAGRDPHRGFSRRRAAPAAVVVEAVLRVIGVSGMPRPVDVLDRGIVLRALVDILDHERDRRPGRQLLAARLLGEHAGEDFDRIRLLALSREAGLTGPPFVQIRLDIGLGQRNARRTAVDHATDRQPVTFAEGRDSEEMAEGVE